MGYGSEYTGVGETSHDRVGRGERGTGSSKRREIARARPPPLRAQTHHIDIVHALIDHLLVHATDGGLASVGSHRGASRHGGASATHVCVY